MVTEWKFSYVPYFGFKSMEEVLKALSRSGYKGVEIPTLHLYKNAEELKGFVELAKSYGLAVSEAGFSLDFVTLNDKLRRDYIDLTKEKIGLAREALIDIVKVFTGPAPWDPKAPKLGKDITEGKAWSLVLDAYNELVDAAERSEVFLAVEACFGMLCHDYYTIKELLDSVKSKYLGVNMDPSHYNLYRNDVPWVVRRLGNKIKHVHMKDSVGKPGMENEDFAFCLLGEGTVDWKGFFQALRDIGYNGFLSVEFESVNYLNNILGGDGAKAVEMCMEQLRKLSALLLETELNERKQ